jgi:cysteine sulfinate desulfinase/cysteine desulfurase-like protein
VAATAGFAAALEVAIKNRVQEEHRIRQLRRELVSSVLATIPMGDPVWTKRRGRSPSRHRQHWLPNLRG